MIKSINPATGALLKEYEPHGEQEVADRLEQARDAFQVWRKTPVAERAQRMGEVARVLRRRRDELARLMTQEMGKLISASEAEVEKCALACAHYAKHGPQYLEHREIASDAHKSFVRYDPLGVVLAVMPWNFPMWQVFRFAAPALVAGNVGLLKHASNVPGTALAIESVFREAGFAEGCFTTLLVGNDQVAGLIEHDAIAAVTLTGSEKAGSSVAEAAGRAIKKTVLELGGADAFIVLKDANVQAVAEKAAEARCINAGQSCIAAKRFIVEAPVADAFEAAFTNAMRGLKVGDPIDRSSQLGPLAREDLVEALEDQVARSAAAGAKLLCGGKRPARNGFYYPPTVLANVRPGMAAFDEETFGPVAAVIRAKDLDEAIALANASRYGLGASLWTADMTRAERIAGEIDAGMVFVNGIVKSDPRLPFGGVKKSGYGRELADVGMHEFVNVKTVWMGEALASKERHVE